MQLTPFCIQVVNKRYLQIRRAYLLKEELIFTRQSCVGVTSATDDFQEKNSITIDVRLLRHLTSDSIFRSQVSSKKK